MDANNRKPVALLSVYDKQGIAQFAQGLVDLGWEIWSSGGTAKELKKFGIEVLDIATIVGKPILGHRVVTLSREIHSGLLATSSPEDMAELEEHNIRRIDLVCVDLYPLEEEIAREGHTRDSVIEKTDIGGPTMISAGAKGRRIVVCDPNDREMVLGWLREGKPAEEAFITQACAKADYVVAAYRLLSAREHSRGEYDGFVGQLELVPKYGENAAQAQAGLYSAGTDDPLALDKFEVVAGQPPSYNNLCDLDRMLQTITHMAAGLRWMRGGAVAVKHGNPCGAAAFVDSFIGEFDQPQRIDILRKMVDGDKRAIFGGLVLTTFEIDEELADVLLTHGMKDGRRLLDGIVAPSFTSGAIGQLKRKGDKCRFIVNAALAKLSADSLDRRARFRHVRGGFLKQPNYTFVPSKELFEVTDHKIVNGDFIDSILAWAIGSTSNSNTITLVKDGQLIGNGVGQQDRVGCCELALKRARDAGHDPKGAVAYSDSFFPFEDGPQVLIDAGIRAIFATSGSIRDDRVREVCDKAGVRLYQLPDAEARGFFGH